MGKKNTTSIKSTDPYAGTGYRNLYQQMYGAATPTIQSGVSSYPGQITPGASDLQSQAFNLLGGYGGQDLSGLNWQQPAQFQQQADNVLNSYMQPYDPSQALQTWQNQFVGPSMLNWQQNVMPGIKEAYLGRGGTAESGTLARAMSRSGADLSTMLGGQLSGLLNQDYQGYMGRQQTGLNQMQSWAQMPGQMMGTSLDQLLNAGGTQRQISAQQMQEPYQKWLGEQPYSNPWLTQLGGLLGGQQPMETYATQNQGWMPQLLQFLGQGAQMGGQIGRVATMG